MSLLTCCDSMVLGLAFACKSRCKQMSDIYNRLIMRGLLRPLLANHPKNPIRTLFAIFCTLLWRKLSHPILLSITEGCDAF